jgi:hypothetical protein
MASTPTLSSGLRRVESDSITAQPGSATERP